MMAASITCCRHGLFSRSMATNSAKSVCQSVLKSWHKVITTQSSSLSNATTLRSLRLLQKEVKTIQRVPSPKLSWQLVTARVPRRLLNQNALPIRPTKHLNEKDGISKEFTLIYKSTVNDKVVFFICFFLGMTVSLSSLYYGFVKVLKLLPQGNTMTIPVIGAEITQLDAAMMSYLLLSLVIVTWFIHKIARLSVVRMYHHEAQDTYIGVVKGRALQNIQIGFGPTDIHPIPMRGFLKASNGNIAIHNYPFIVFNADFLIPEYYNKLASLQASGQAGVGSGTGQQKRKGVRPLVPTQDSHSSEQQPTAASEGDKLADNGQSEKEVVKKGA